MLKLQNVGKGSTNASFASFGTGLVSRDSRWSVQLLLLVGATILLVCAGSSFGVTGPCYAGEPLPVPGGNQISPIGLPVCELAEDARLRGRSYFDQSLFWWVNRTRRSFSAGPESSPSTALMYLLSMGENPSPAFIGILNVSNPELVCGSCICMLCNGTQPNGTVIAPPSINPNVTLSPSVYRGGPWFPFANGSLPLDTPSGWNISNTDRHLSEYCKMPASPFIQDSDTIVIGMNNLSICGGCVRLRTLPILQNLHSGSECERVGNSQSWDRQTPSLWTEPDLSYVNCSIYPRYRWTSAGWFDGYSSEEICVAQSASLPFGCLTVGTGYYGRDRWCPTLSQTLDPVICNRSGTFDRQCTRQFYAGQSVNGNALFCSQYGCNVNSQCHCSFRDIVDLEEYFINGSWVSGSTISIVMGVETAESNGIRLRMPGNPQTDEQMFLSVFDDVLKIVYLDAQDRTVSLAKTGMSDWFFCQTKVCTRTLQDATFLASGYLKVMSISSNNKTAVGETWIVGRSSCYKYDCSFCPEDLQNFHCLDTSYQIVVVMGGICLFLVALILIMVVLCYGAWILMWIAKKFGRCFFATPLGDRTDSTVRNFFNMFIPRASQTMVILMLFCVCADCCDNFYVQQTNLTNCVEDVSGLFENCEMVADIQLTLPYLGSTSCLSLVDENGVFITHLEITYESAVMELQYSLQYFTSSFDITTEEDLRCSARIFNSGCDRNTCKNGPISRDGQGNLDNILAVSYPGMTFCNLAFEGSVIEPWPACFFGNDCYYSAFGIRPRGTVYSVNKLVKEGISSSIRLNITTASGYLDASLSFANNPNVIYGDYTMTLTMGGNPSRLELADLSLITSVSNDTAFKAFLGFASPVNQPRVGTVGDIQANVASALTGERVPEQAELAYDPQIMLSRTFNDGANGHVEVSWVFSKPGINSIATITGGEIPGLYQGTPIKFRGDNVLWYPLDTAPAAVLSMSGPSVYVSRSISSVCPTFEILETTGCRSCTRGCDMVIKAKSSCLAGTAFVSTKTDSVRVTTSIVFLGDDFANITVKFQTNESKLTVDICLSATTTECHESTFQTVEVNSGELVNQTSKIETITGDNDASDDSWFMFKWIGDLFKGVGKWWQSLLAIMFWFAMLILLIVALWFTFPLWWPLLTWVIGKFRSMLGKVGNTVKSKEMEMLPVKEPAQRDLMAEAQRNLRNRRDVTKVFTWN